MSSQPRLFWASWHDHASISSQVWPVGEGSPRQSHTCSWRDSSWPFQVFFLWTRLNTIVLSSSWKHQTSVGLVFDNRTRSRVCEQHNISRSSHRAPALMFVLNQLPRRGGAGSNAREFRCSLLAPSCGFPLCITGGRSSGGGPSR